MKTRDPKKPPREIRAAVLSRRAIHALVLWSREALKEIPGWRRHREKPGRNHFQPPIFAPHRRHPSIAPQRAEWNRFRLLLPDTSLQPATRSSCFHRRRRESRRRYRLRESLALFRRTSAARLKKTAVELEGSGAAQKAARRELDFPAHFLEFSVPGPSTAITKAGVPRTFPVFSRPGCAPETREQVPAR